LLAIFMSNAGGAWDNAKKSFEKGVMINGEMFYKKSEPHKASVTGDTVGDPFKDTSGPSMNILIKLMSIVSLVIAPFIVGKTFGESNNQSKILMLSNCKSMSPCDMDKCATLSKEECRKMCEANHCDSSEKAACMAMYDSNGKFIGSPKSECSNESACKEKNDTPCSKGDACCKSKKM
ncbi:MAG: sodium/proton-translocating pyrophosphatase, partial [Bacteroidetes bacterium]|nr:sodium/proton-translocating pyrophosphatase [Bacteroidota bacterium]